MDFLCETDVKEIKIVIVKKNWSPYSLHALMIVIFIFNKEKLFAVRGY